MDQLRSLRKQQESLVKEVDERARAAKAKREAFLRVSVCVCVKDVCLCERSCLVEEVDARARAASTKQEAFLIVCLFVCSNDVCTAAFFTQKECLICK